MTKADIITKISRKNLIEEPIVSQIIESFMVTVKDSLANNENVYLREFGSFVVKHRAPKHARNISQKVNIILPARNIPVFKPSEKFTEKIK